MLKSFNLVLLSIFCLPCISQINLVNNSNFEDGNPTNRNNSTCQYQSFSGFDNDINNFSHIIIQNQNRTLVPHWIDLSKDTCRMFSQYYSGSGSILFPTQSTIAYSNEYNYYYNNKVLLLETDIQTNFFPFTS